MDVFGQLLNKLADSGGPGWTVAAIVFLGAVLVVSRLDHRLTESTNSRIAEMMKMAEDREKSTAATIQMTGTMDDLNRLAGDRLTALQSLESRHAAGLLAIENRLAAEAAAQRSTLEKVIGEISHFKSAIEALKSEVASLQRRGGG